MERRTHTVAPRPSWGVTPVVYPRAALGAVSAVVARQKVTVVPAGGLGPKKAEGTGIRTWSARGTQLAGNVIVNARAVDHFQMAPRFLERDSAGVKTLSPLMSSHRRCRHKNRAHAKKKKWCKTRACCLDKAGAYIRGPYCMWWLLTAEWNVYAPFHFD